MHEFIFAIQNLLVVVCISYKPCNDNINIINEIKKTKKKFLILRLLLVFLRLINNDHFCKVEPALLEEIIISLDFVAKCVNFFFVCRLKKYDCSYFLKRAHIHNRILLPKFSEIELVPSAI
jgi:hypothetical protein